MNQQVSFKGQICNLMCVLCIVSNYVNKTNKMLSFYTYIYSIIFMSTLHVSNDRVIHNQEFSLLTVFTALHKIVQTCPAAGGHGQPSEFFLSGLQKLEQRAKKCIELRGVCVE